MSASQPEIVSQHLSAGYVGKLRDLVQVAEKAGAFEFSGAAARYIEAGAVDLLAVQEVDAALFAASCRCDRERGRMFGAILLKMAEASRQAHAD